VGARAARRARAPSSVAAGQRKRKERGRARIPPTLTPHTPTPHTHTESLIASELAQGKTFAVPPSTTPPPPSGSPSSSPARPLLLSLSARHFRARRSPAAVGELSLIYAMDALATAASAAASPSASISPAAPKGDGRVISVVDMRGVGLANLDSETSKAVVRIAQAAYPERLAATVIYGAPAIFSAVWAVLGRLLAPASLGKVFFLPAGGDWGSPALRAAGVDAASIPACLGGAGGEAVRAVPIQAFARSVGLGPRGGAVVPLEAGLVDVAGDPLAGGGGARKEVEAGGGGGGLVVAARAG
jgi:hypothetical protein